MIKTTSQKSNKDSKGRFVKGHKHTPEALEKNRISHLGKIPANKLKVIKKNCLHCKKVLLLPETNKKKFCSRDCYGKSILGKRKSEKFKLNLSKYNKSINKKPPNPTGRKLSEETRQKISNSHKGMKKPWAPKGEKHHFWKGGTTPERTKIWRSKEYQNWRKEVFERDSYTCVLCKKRGGILNADHIKPFSIYKELRFVLENGRTLCIKCHRKTDTYGINVKNYKLT